MSTVESVEFGEMSPMLVLLALSINEMEQLEEGLQRLSAQIERGLQRHRAAVKNCSSG